MTRKHLQLVLAAALTAGNAAAQDPNSANVVVTLPADATLFINGVRMSQTGATRNFYSPALTPGKTYSYELRAEIVRDGQPVSETQNITVRAGQTSRADFSSLGRSAAPIAAGAPEVADPWPRKISSDGYTITVYQPQLETWEKDLLEARAAVAVETRAKPQPVYGVIWLTARTAVDKENRTVTLDNFRIPKANFPSAPDRAEEYLAVLRKNVPPGTRTLALDRLEANLAVARAESKPSGVPLKNDPPLVIYSPRPALLVLVDGKPALRQTGVGQLLRVINTRALLLFDQVAARFYLRMMDRWMEARSLDGPWEPAKAPTGPLDQVLKTVADDPQVDLLDDPAPDLKDALAEGILPTLYVSTDPAELIETQGKPDLAPIDGTKLLWVKNTTDQLLLDTADQNWYVLLSGRWFRSKSLDKGPWEFVPGDKLPADFAKVPETHPRGDVLTSVPGTPQAKEALIADNVPQTATVRRSEANLAPVYDGEPQFQPIQGTDLKYAVNTPTPIVQVAPDRYYGCENGVWFTATAPAGPWAAATSVPPVIYTIPPDSPIYYVTNVYVYGYTPEYVYIGYTPGYLGTCIAPWGTVVYGTGWYHRPWIGRYWFGRPWTYGWGARFSWTAAGWGFGFTAAVSRPWWGPVGWQAGWGGRGWRAGWERGWGGRYANAHINHINLGNFNVYNRWNNNVHVAPRTTVNVGRQTNVTAGRGTVNNVVAGRDGNVYRRAEGGWVARTGQGWQRVDPARLSPERRTEFTNTSQRLNNEWAARRVGEANYNAYRSAAGNWGGRGAVESREAVGGYGGLNANYGGFRSYGGARGGRGRR